MKLQNRQEASPYDKQQNHYEFWQQLMCDDKIRLCHFTGTHPEIHDRFQELSKETKASGSLKFPAVISFQNINQRRGYERGMVSINYNISIVTQVKPEWSTQERIDLVHRPVLMPIYSELICQIKRSGFFHTPIGDVPHAATNVFTTGKPFNAASKLHYGFHLDAIELTNFDLKFKFDECNINKIKIETESNYVTNCITQLNF